jgi:hypothetical protein
LAQHEQDNFNFIGDPGTIQVKMFFEGLARILVKFNPPPQPTNAHTEDWSKDSKKAKSFTSQYDIYSSSKFK